MPPRKSDSAPPRKSDTDDGATSISAAAADESRLSTTDKRDKDKESKDGVTIEVRKDASQAGAPLADISLGRGAPQVDNRKASKGANEHTMAANKKTISPADVFRALDDVEFSFLKEPLEAEFAKFNQIQIEKRTNYRRKVRTKPDGDGDGDDAEMADATVAGTTVSSERDAGPRTKKARVDDDAAEEDDAETEEEGDVQEEDEDEEDEDEGEEEEEEEEEEHHDGDAAAQASGDETQDALEERLAREEGDEALDGDESD
ncbi:hypothetical protein EsDP_00002960 [Epichloe bromicola]|uniref:DNA polymerase epsilon subunit D n=1 Tax=Epichloe bromicola TaxID=79588 RepID=A0ABQ0CMC1_9HYPO